MMSVRSMSAAVLLTVLACWMFSMLGSYDVVLDVDPNRANASPSAELWLGADDSGRSVFKRLIKGTEAFVGPGILACFVAFFVAVPLGSWAGWAGGWTGESIRFLFTSIAALPRFVLVLLVCSVYGTDGTTLGLAAGLAYAPALSEAVYSRVSSFRSAGFVMAAKAHGLTTTRILGWHILWVNAKALIARHLLQLFGYFLLVETTLSFLGDFGVQEPQPSWGNMISRDALQGGMTDLNLWASAAPILAIWLTILSCTQLAQSLEEVDDA